MDFNIYNDIKKRTNGEIYIGVVGPVRCGKSTFIKNFMNLAIVPNIQDENDMNRAMDELPQSSAGKMIMTTEPKFVPNNGVNITLGDKVDVKVRLIDCVGYMVDGATGYMEEDKERMVKTPWFDFDVPFSKAAEIGTRKVIEEHSTIGIVMTSDGSFTELDVESYNEALDKTINELNKINKPYIVIINTLNPNSEECISLKKQIEEKYNVTALAINCLELTNKDIDMILESVLFEFPITEVIIDTPKWLEIFSRDNELIRYIIDYSKELFANLTKVKDINQIKLEPESAFIKDAFISGVELSNGVLKARFVIDDIFYYKLISSITNDNIDNQLQLIKYIKDISKNKENYEKISNAIEKVKDTGYGIVAPNRSDITLDNPELIKNGNKYGVKIKATAPSIHFVKANIVTELSPIIGEKQQADDLIDFINKKEDDEDIWDTNIFGKSIGQIVDDGIINKINNLTEETQSRMQGTIEKITNDQSKGVICILL